LKHVKVNVGTTLKKALEAIEDNNIDALQDVLKGIKFNRKIGQRTLDDDTLADFVQNFEKIPLKDEDFEFPDLLGAAYEYLIKYFADEAGKKAGEFCTPVEVVRICVEICDPQEGMSAYDPTAGSGGMLIQRQDYLRECGGNPNEISLTQTGNIARAKRCCGMANEVAWWAIIFQVLSHQPFQNYPLMEKLLVAYAITIYCLILSGFKIEELEPVYHTCQKIWHEYLD